MSVSQTSPGRGLIEDIQYFLVDAPGAADVQGVVVRQPSNFLRRDHYRWRPRELCRLISDIENRAVRRHTQGMPGAKRQNFAGDRIAHRDRGTPYFRDLLQFHFPPCEQRRNSIKLHNPRRYDDIPYEEIGGILDLSVRAAKSVLFRARTELRYLEA